MCIGEEGHVGFNPDDSHGCCETAHDSAAAASLFSHADEAAPAGAVHDDDCCIDIPLFTDWCVRPARERSGYTLKAQAAYCCLVNTDFSGKARFGESATQHFPAFNLPLVQLRTVVFLH